MKIAIVFIFVVIIFSGCTNQESMKKPLTIDLNQNWQFRQAGEKSWLPATVPGTVHTDLMDNGIIEDPFYRVNEKSLQWIDKKDWEYNCEFDIGADLIHRENIELVFYGLDTYSQVFLNDSLILESDNMFRQWQVDCKKYLLPGVNNLRVVLLSPTRIGLEKLDANGYPLPASNDQSENGEMGDKKVSIFTRKAGYHYGWDWGPRLVTSGIWRPVELRAWNKAAIKDVSIITHTLTEKKANIAAHVEIWANDNFSAKVSVSIRDGELKSKIFDIHKSGNILMFDFEIEDPDLWWPNGNGSQHLYNLNAQIEIKGENGNVDMDEHEIQFGLRTVQLIQQPDEEGNGKSFYFEVNGVPMFAKGANVIPNDVFLPRFSPEDYERIIKAAADANMNMLRVWGGGIYENDIFYNLCDRYGIMVWQDFMYACSMYPGDDAFLTNARLEARENIKRLRNHPSIVLWCGNNENEVAWGEYEEGRGWGWKERYNDNQRAAIWKNYDTLFHQILPKAVKSVGNGVPYWHSSPSAGMGELASYENNRGDMHYWGVWHGQHPFSDFKKYKARFMSEYGFQSFPELNTVASYALPEEWDIESEVMAAHQRSGIGNLRIKQYMEDDYVIPDEFDQFLYVSQLLQAEGIKMAVKSHRTDMPYCMGSLYWQLNDCWPVASWSGIDYFGRWKAMHYFVKDAFKQTIVATFQENDSIKIWVVSDNQKEVNGLLSIKLLDFEGKEYWSERMEIMLPANNSKMLFKKESKFFKEFVQTENSFLSIELIVGDEIVDNETQFFVKPKNRLYKDPQLEIEIREQQDQFELIISSSTLTSNVFLSTSLSRDHFSDNYFDVLPGQKKTVVYPKVASIAEFKSSLTVVSLNETMKQD